MLNRMCKKCVRFGIDCKGTENQVWSGCVYKITDPLNLLKELLEKLSQLEDLTNQADAEYEVEPENAEKEKAFDEAYKAEYDAFMAVSALIVKMSNGQIDEKTASEIVRVKRNEIFDLVA